MNLIASLRGELLRLQRHAAASDELAAAILRSKTWRLTRPLRALYALARFRLLR